jgi:hypothetical protein
MYDNLAVSRNDHCGVRIGLFTVGNFRTSFSIVISVY